MQIAVLQILLITKEKVEEEEEVALRPSSKFNVEMAKPSLFDEEASNIVGFMTACKLYIRMKMKEVVIEE